MHIFITGVAGFLGSNLADFFLNNGYKVFGLDNFITGHQRNIDHLTNNPNFEFIESELGQFCQNKELIHDRVGMGLKKA